MDKSVENLDLKVEELQEWIKTQPQLPQNIDKKVLKIFLIAKDGNVEASKVLLEYHFKFRLKHHHIFLDRDPLDKGIQQQLEVESLLQLPGITPNNYKLFLNRLNDYDPEKYNFTEVIKTFFLMTDVFGRSTNEDYQGEVVVFDMAGMTWRHHLRVSLGTVRIFMKAVQEAYPLRLKQVHVINATPLIDTIVRWTKPLMNSELFNMLQIHMPNSETPYEYFPRDMLPEEYGGKAGKLADLQKYWKDKLMENRDYLIDESRWKYKTL